MGQTVLSDCQTRFAAGLAAQSRTDPMEKALENSAVGLEHRRMGPANPPNLVETVVDPSRMVARSHTRCEAKDSTEHTDQTSLPPGGNCVDFRIATLEHILKAISTICMPLR